MIVFGEESQVQEVATVFIALMQQARLDNKLSLRELNIGENSKVGLSIDIDFATTCPTCERKMKMGHVYHALGTDLTGVYTQLDAFCPPCGWERLTRSLPPMVVSVHDRSRRASLRPDRVGAQLCARLARREQSPEWFLQHPTKESS